MSDPVPIDVLVVDDHPMFSEALSMLLEQRTDVRLVGAAEEADEALRLCLATAPDVVLMDLDLPGVDGIEATRRIRHSCPSVKVLVLSGLPDPGLMAGALAAGACGYVSKTRAVDDLVDAVRRAFAGEIVMPEADLAPVLAVMQNGRELPGGVLGLRHLTPREREVLGQLAEGRAITEVADALGISALTVQSHVKNVLAKLGVHSRLEAVTLAWRHGLPTASRSA